ncbi:hypothetical protein ACWCW2_06070 [Streptomyces sp. NPDC001773]|uniref:hypothetical protein n=1 Tax=Streptomyces sp. NPDC005245 TaxID=3157029 RepID=UPI00339F476D
MLCNFAAVDRLSLLEKVLDGRGRWTQAVAAEAEQSTRYWPRLRQVAEDGWLGDPIEIDDPAETALVDRMRRVVFAGHRPGRCNTWARPRRWSSSSTVES